MTPRVARSESLMRLERKKTRVKTVEATNRKNTTNAHQAVGGTELINHARTLTRESDRIK